MNIPTAQPLILSFYFSYLLPLGQNFFWEKAGPFKNEHPYSTSSLYIYIYIHIYMCLFSFGVLVLLRQTSLSSFQYSFHSGETKSLMKSFWQTQMGIIHLLCMRSGKFLKISQRKATLRANGCLCMPNKVFLQFTILMCHLKKKKISASLWTL